MKRSTAALIIILVFSIFAACGSDDPPYIPPVDPPPAIQNTVDFSCISVDNDQICSGILEGSIWNSGPVQTTGDPMPVDYLNIEITNNMDIDAVIFSSNLITISGCGDNPAYFDIQHLAPGESVALSYQLWNYRCGMLGYQETIISLYNASGFNPADFPTPWEYPRTDLIANAVVIWDNRLPGDIP